MAHATRLRSRVAEGEKGGGRGQVGAATVNPRQSWTELQFAGSMWRSTEAALSKFPPLPAPKSKINWRMSGRGSGVGSGGLGIGEWGRRRDRTVSLLSTILTRTHTHTCSTIERCHSHRGLGRLSLGHLCLSAFRENNNKIITIAINIDININISATNMKQLVSYELIADLVRAN